MLIALTLAFAPVALAAPTFAQLPTHGAAARITWSWPAASRFETTLETPARTSTTALGKVFTLERDGVGADVARMVANGKSLADIAAWVEASAGSKTYAEAVAVAELPPSGPGSVSIDTLRWGSRFGDATDWTVHTKGDVALMVAAGRVVAITDAAIAPHGKLHPGAWVDWVYATTLMQSDPAVYDADRGTHEGNDAVNEKWEALEKAMVKGAKEGLAAYEGFPVDQLGDRDWRLGTLARFLTGAGRPDEAIRVYRRFAPVGRCSMDRAPANTAQAYADTCYERGHIGCFLQLQVRIMGDRFERAVWSSYGERAASTNVSRLSDAGIDVRRFLRGLLVDFTVAGPKREWIGRWRLVRSMKESGMGADFVRELEGLATDTELDGYNRLRATQALWLMWRRAEDIGQAKAKLRFSKLDLDPVSVRWIAAVEKMRGSE